MHITNFHKFRNCDVVGKQKKTLLRKTNRDIYFPKLLTLAFTFQWSTGGEIMNSNSSFESTFLSLQSSIRELCLLGFIRKHYKSKQMGEVSVVYCDVTWRVHSFRKSLNRRVMPPLTAKAHHFQLQKQNILFKCKRKTPFSNCKSNTIFPLKCKSNTILPLKCKSNTIFLSDCKSKTIF